MASKYLAILTNIGAAKLANAAALGNKLEITQMAIGDGNGTLPTPDPAQTVLVREVRRAPVNSLTIDPKNPSQIIAEQVLPEDVGGWWIREAALLDKDGNMIAIANCPETYKPRLQEGSGRVQVIRIVLIVSSSDAITLKIDPAIVLATRQYADEKAIEVRGYVDSQLQAHERSRNHPDATTTAKGFVQLSSDDNSTDERKAATPAAVKKVRDLAAVKAPINSPALTGEPTAPTPPKTDNSKRLSTTAHVKATLADYAPLNSPVLTGSPTTPTPSASARGRELVNAEFVAAKIATLVGSAPGVMDTLQEIASALNNNPNFANEIIRQLAAKQPLNATLTALSGKNVAQLLEYLGLRGTVDQAAGALQKAQNGSDIPNKDKFTQTIGAARAVPALDIDGTGGNWTTAQFIQWLVSRGAFNHPYWVCKGSWSYAGNKTITDTGCGNIQLAGCVIEVMGNRSAMTIRVTTPTTTVSNNAQFTYINHGSDYSPGWRRDYNTRNPQPAFALGRTGDTAATDKGIAWDAPSGVYQANVNEASCMILHFNMGVGSCPAVQFKVNYRNGGIAYRSARDRAGFESDWVELMPATKTVQDIRLSTRERVQVWNGPGYGDQPPYVITGVLNSNRDEVPDTVYRRALQKLINGTWYNVGGL